MSGNIRKVQLEYGLRGDKVIFVSELTDLERKSMQLHLSGMQETTSCKIRTA